MPRHVPQPELDAAMLELKDQQEADRLETLAATERRTAAQAKHDALDAVDAGLQTQVNSKAATTDARFTDARTPTSHHTSHEPGGADAISISALGAVTTGDSRLSDSRVPTAHKSTHYTGGADAIPIGSLGGVATSDSRLTDPRTPLPHAASHATGSTDPIPALTRIGAKGKKNVTIPGSLTAQTFTTVVTLDADMGGTTYVVTGQIANPTATLLGLGTLLYWCTPLTSTTCTFNVRIPILGLTAQTVDVTVQAQP